VALRELFELSETPSFHNSTPTTALPRLHAYLDILEDENFNDVKSLESALIGAGVDKSVAADYCANILWVLQQFGVPESMVCHQALSQWIEQLVMNRAWQLFEERETELGDAIDNDSFKDERDGSGKFHEEEKVCSE
jgi:AraC-like DNA-binding protein